MARYSATALMRDPRNFWDDAMGAQDAVLAGVAGNTHTHICPAQEEDTTPMRRCLLLAVAGLIATGPASACKPPPQVPAGFIHAQAMPDSVSEHLPANAKGVLFWLGGGAAYYWLRSTRVHESFFLGKAPTPIDRREFFITELPGGRPLPVTVEPVSYHQSKARYLLARQPRLARCILQNMFSLDGCMPLEHNVEKLIATGAFRDVTDAVRHSRGLFRIAPARGFTPGHRYHIRFVVPHPKYMPYAYPVDMDVTIDPTPVRSWPPKALRATRAPRDIRPDEDKAVYVDFRLAPDLLPYRQSLYFAADATPPPSEPHPMPPCHFEQPFTAAPGVRPLRLVDEQCHRIDGKAAFLELADGWFGLAPIWVNCPSHAGNHPLD